jgi:hypothetical protein
MLMRSISLPSPQLLVSVRPAIGRVDFPSKRLNVAEIGAMVSERVDLLQKFLRKVSSLVCINSLHPSTAKVQLALQQFLEVTDRMDNIAILESRQPTMSEKNMVQVFVHSVMQMACLDKVCACRRGACRPRPSLPTHVHSPRICCPPAPQVLSGFVDTVNENYSAEAVQAGKRWGEADGRRALGTVKEFLDNLQVRVCPVVTAACPSRRIARVQAAAPERTQSVPPQGVLCDAVADDCLDIMRKYRRDRIGGPSGGKADPRRPAHRNGFRYVDARSRQPTSSSSSGNGATRRDDEPDDDVLAQCTEDELRAQVRSSVRRQVEIEAYVPCSLRLWAALDRAFAPAEANLRRNMLAIAHQPQSFFGIPVQHLSPSSWDEVVYALRDVRSKTLPHDRLEALLAAAKEIPDVFTREHPGADQPLGADDFLPIFIYVLARAQIPELLALNEELQALCDPDKRMSETGYYLATLEASLQHIAEADVTADSEALFPMLNSMNRSFSDDEDDDDDDDDDDDRDVGGNRGESKDAEAAAKLKVADKVSVQPPLPHREEDEHKGVAPSSSAAPSGDTVEDDDDDEFAAFLDHDASSSSSRPGEPECKEKNGGARPGLLRALSARSGSDDLGADLAGHVDDDDDGHGVLKAGAVARVDEPYGEGEDDGVGHDPAQPSPDLSSRGSSGYTDYIGFETVLHSPK